MKLNYKITGSLAIAFAAIMWGLDGVVLTPRLFNLNVAFVVMVLHLLPFAIMNLFMWREYRLLKQFALNDWLVFSGIALTGGALGTLAIVKALFLVNFEQLSIVVLLQKLQPVFAILLASVLLKEKITLRFLVWALIAITAGYFLTFEWGLPKMHSDRNTILAALFALIAAFSFGSSTVLSKMVLNTYHFKTVTFYRYGFTSVIMVLVVLFANQWNQIYVATRINWLFFIIIGLTTGSGAIFLYYYGLRNVSAIVSVIVELLFPLSAIGFDYLINGFQLSWIQWISAALMLFAIIRLNFKRRLRLRQLLQKFKPS